MHFIMSGISDSLLIDTSRRVCISIIRTFYDCLSVSALFLVVFLLVLLGGRFVFACLLSILSHASFYTRNK